MHQVPYRIRGSMARAGAREGTGCSSFEESCRSSYLKDGPDRAPAIPREAWAIEIGDLRAILHCASASFQALRESPQRKTPVQRPTWPQSPPYWAVTSK
ncbi:hypothetical protein N7462_007160 [Penicillium macrosclerotiorum]|uniref:uncharacterized protein n=1 Tax=Penicillium macrosclerotiorum TaxID=303699 RepID=UPI0025465895|nr:uncharacterized protein N7462_007160 [Penicillium macrosclerotiorum]KAJ5678916.1 hypothetical protein N7462_007160 [Penicillium macrosclerotiorum]